MSSNQPNINSNNNNQFTRKKIQNYSYGLKDTIGKGYSSQVYRGRNDDKDEQSSVAVKVIDLKMLKNQINRQLLENQIEILKELKSQGCCQNILILHDVYTTKNNTYLITELCQSDMTRVIKSKLSQKEVYFYMHQVLQGYKQIHKHQVVHRDLKPANLLTTQDKVIKVADFGFAIKMKELLSKPSKYNVGSPLYMAPESLRKNQYSYKTDLWSIGVIFFQMLTGDTPWRAKTQKQLIKKIQNESIGKILGRFKFSKMTVEFLTKILNIDKNARLSPQELYRYDFSVVLHNSEDNILCQRKINIMPNNRNNRFQSFNGTTFVSPKNNIFNQSIDKNFFQKQKSEKNINLSSKANIKSSNKNDVKLNTMKQLKQDENKNPLLSYKNIQQLGKNLVTNPENLTARHEDKKSISKILISIVHFCRFLFKLLNRIKQSEMKGILKQMGYFEAQGVFYSYTKTIKYLIGLLGGFKSVNFLNLQSKTYQSYKQTSDYVKLMKITSEYNERYSSELKTYWDDSESENNKFSTVQTVNLISVMINYSQDFFSQNSSQSDFQKQTEAQKLSKEIIIIDYLMTAKQLLQMFKQGSEDFYFFSKKSRIQDIVQGTTSQITYPLYLKIAEKAKVFSAPSMNNTRHPRNAISRDNSNKNIFSQKAIRLNH